MINEELIPMSQEELANVNYDLHKVSFELIDLPKWVLQLAHDSQELNEHQAAMINSWLHVQNLKKSAASVNMYVGLIRMLIDNMKADLAAIYRERDAYKIDAERRQSALAAAARQKKYRDANKSDPDTE